MLRAATSVLIAAVAASVTFGVVSATSSSDSLDTAATANRTAARQATPAPAAPDPTPPPTPPTSAPSSEGAAVVDLLNAERARRGLAAVSIHPLVTEAAEVHSADQAATRTMSHRGSDGSNTGQRLDRVGFDWRGWAENVGAGHPNAAIIFDGWMNSTGHRDNMLGTYRYIGVAVAESSDGTKYWTMVLAN